MDRDPFSFPTLAYFFLFQILGFVAKGCPLLELVYLNVCWREDPVLAGLIALSTLGRLSSLFIYVHFSDRNSPAITPADSEAIRVSLDAIVERGLLEVRKGCPRGG